MNCRGQDWRKKACKCGHGIAIHHARTATRGKQFCWHPGCKCKDYGPVVEPTRNQLSSSTARHDASRAV
jgi:hypothetical protein